MLGGYEFFEGVVEGGEVGVVLDGVEGGVVAVIALVLPYVYYFFISYSFASFQSREERDRIGEGPY